VPLALRERIRLGSTRRNAEGSGDLPLTLSHADVNAMNIIINREAKVVGLIDRERVLRLPVGTNGWYIGHFSVTNRYYVIPDQFGEGFVPDGKDITGRLEWIEKTSRSLLVASCMAICSYTRMCIIPFIVSKTTHLCMEDTDDSGKP
jgi:hypothetical protein